MKRTVVWIAVAVTAIHCAAGHRQALGQIGYCPCSVELLTDSADIVVLASVADVSWTDRAPETRARSGLPWATVTLKVKATLKGKAPDSIVFTEERLRGDEDLSRWKKSRQPVLCFLEDIRGRKEETPADLPAVPKGCVRLRKTELVELGPKAAGRPQIAEFSMDFRVLDEDDKIVAAVKAELARREKGPARAISLGMPREVAQRCGTSGDVNSLWVPVNSHLEELGRAWVASKEDWLRLDGVKALTEFKSEKNAALLKGLLNDQGQWMEVNEGDRSEARVYPVREAAYKTLQQWKVAAAKPLLREPLKEK